jgi:hypothetical protein
MAKGTPGIVLLYIFQRSMPTEKPFLIARASAMERTQLHIGLLSLWTETQAIQDNSSQLQRTIKIFSLDPVRNDSS